MKSSLVNEVINGKKLKTITIVCTPTAETALMHLLEALQHLGRVGASRSIKIQDDPTNYDFDGDGADKILVA
jgi:hypothetical protein